LDATKKLLIFFYRLLFVQIIAFWRFCADFLCNMALFTGAWRDTIIASHTSTNPLLALKRLVTATVKFHSCTECCFFNRALPSFQVIQAIDNMKKTLVPIPLYELTKKISNHHDPRKMLSVP